VCKSYGGSADEILVAVVGDPKEELLFQIGRLVNENRPEACLGCGFERRCSVHGCRVLKKAIKILEKLDGNIKLEVTVKASEKEG
jgi:hypothetical protein